MGKHMKDEFLAWLKGLPSDAWVKRQLLRSWREYHNVSFKDEDYTKAGF